MIYNDLEQIRERLHAEIDSLAVKAQEAAIAETEYQKAKAKRVLELKAAGYAATLIEMVIKGDVKVNEKLYKALSAEADYKSTQELINVLKLDAKLLEEQIKREWSVSGEY